MRRDARVDERQLDVSKGVRARQQVEGLEDEPDLRLRISASSSSTIEATSWPLNSYRPAVGVSRQPSMFISVDLPDPEGP
jgi:hypothetical protein